MPRSRSLLAVVAASLLTGLPAATRAHAELMSSQPPADAVLDRSPTEVVVTFESELDPDTSNLAVADAAGASVGEGGVDLDVADRNVLRAEVDVTDDGEYEVSWTAGSIDGHVETGTFMFRVRAPVADTALPAPPSGSVLIGALLLAGGFAVGARQWRMAER